jgi:hypothetical protein
MNLSSEERRSRAALLKNKHNIRQITAIYKVEGYNDVGLFKVLEKDQDESGYDCAQFRILL